MLRSPMGTRVGLYFTEEQARSAKSSWTGRTTLSMEELYVVRYEAEGNALAQIFEITRKEEAETFVERF